MAEQPKPIFEVVGEKREAIEAGAAASRPAPQPLSGGKMASGSGPALFPPKPTPTRTAPAATTARGGLAPVSRINVVQILIILGLLANLALTIVVGINSRTEASASQSEITVAAQAAMIADLKNQIAACRTQLLRVEAQSAQLSSRLDYVQSSSQTALQMAQMKAPQPPAHGVAPENSEEMK